jgi:hypothetical protein
MSSYNALVASFRPTKFPEIEEGKGNEFEAKMTNLSGLEAQQETFEFYCHSATTFYGRFLFLSQYPTGIPSAFLSNRL